LLETDGSRTQRAISWLFRSYLIVAAALAFLVGIFAILFVLTL
jgi:hypothetical protein